MFRVFSTLIILFLASWAPAGWQPLLDYLQSSQDLPPFLRHLQTLAPHLVGLPGRPFLFAIAFFIATWITCRHRNILSLTDLVVLCMLVPLTAWGVSVLGGTFNRVLGAVEAPPYMVPVAIGTVTGFLLALIIRSGLHFEDDFGIGYCLIIALLMGALIIIPAVLPAFSYTSGIYFYPLLGFLIAVPVAKANRRGAEE